MEGEIACSLRCKSPDFTRPNMSDLRIVLVGKNASENNRVGNLILDKQAFGKKTSQPDVEEHNETVEGRNITVINTINMLKSKVSLQKIAQKVSEFSHPEPDVIILVLQHNDFSERKRDKLPSVLKCFGEQAIERTMIVTTDDETPSAKQKPVKENEFIQQISTECGGGHLQLQNTQRSQILQNVDEIINRVSNVYSISEKLKLILVLCGCNEELKASMSKLLLGKNMPISAKQGLRSVYVIEEEKIHGHLISLVKFPALNQLSEEEATHQTLRCMSLCDPGVHVFLLIVPDAPLTDEDKAEMEKMIRIFDSREHFIVVFITSLSIEEHVTDLIESSAESQKLINRCGGQFRVIGLKEPENSRQIPDLLDYIENMKIEPYSSQMYVKAQENRVRRETEEKYKEELKRMEDEIDGLKQKIQSEGSDNDADDLECLRIVLIGRTGSGKSATGNTILGRKEFQSKSSSNSMTTVCQKGVGEVDGRSVAVVDTPGLFDTTLSNDLVAEEIMKCVSLSSPGPHVFVIVLSVGRIVQVEMDTVDLIKKIFGPKAAQFSIILFTRGDELEESIEDYVKESMSAELKKLIRDCGNRFLSFNNREKQDRTQVIQLLNMIEEVKNDNQGRFFSNSMFEEAEMSIKKKMEEILKDKDREIQNQIELLKDKYEMEMKIVLKTLEDEKERADEERIKMENQLREKEKNLRKEIEEKEKTKPMKQESENQKRSEDEKQKAEYHQKIEEMKREIENQRSLYEKQEKEREEKNKKRKEKYRQNQEKMRIEQERMIAELKIKQEEEIKKRESEEKRRHEEEEEERLRWKRKIKEAENDRKETQEEIKRQQREWEDEKKRQTREREEEERRRKERHEEQLREKQEELEKMRKRFEREREEEQQKIEEERQKQRREREEKEREYEEKKTEIERLFKQLEHDKKEEWERRKVDDERRKEERKRWKRMIEDLKQEREKEIKRREKEEKERKEREEKTIDEMKRKHEEEIKDMKKKQEEESRIQAAEFHESTEIKLKHVLELTEMLKERKKQQELLENLKEKKGEETK